MKIEELFRVDGQALEDEILSQPDPEQMVRIAELFLSKVLPGHDGNVELIDRSFFCYSPLLSP